MEIYEKIEKWFKTIPHTLKYAFLGTVCSGLLAHMFCYTHMLLWHDSVRYTYQKTDIFSLAAAGRWFNSVVFNWMGNVVTPWLMGIVVLFFFSLSVFFICDSLNIYNKLAIVLVSGLIITNRTVTITNLYISGSHTFAVAMALATFSVWAYSHLKKGWIWSWLSLYLCASLYSSYIDVALSLFLIQQICVILFYEIGVKRVFFKHIKMFFVSVSAYFTSYYTDLFLLRLRPAVVAQERLENIEEMSSYSWAQNVLYALERLWSYFSPNSRRAEFQGIKILYLSFFMVCIMTIILIISIIVSKRLWKNAVLMMVLVADFTALVFSMNLIDVICPSYDLHHLAYVTPWIFFVQLCCCFDNKKEKISKLYLTYKNCYSVVVILLSIITIGVGCKVANTAYTKVYNNIESALNLLNRVVDRVESVDGYIPGETPVIILGDTREYYEPYVEQYELVGGLQALFQGEFSTALTHDAAVKAYLSEHLRVDMNIIDFRYGDYKSRITNGNEYIEYIYETTGYQLEFAQLGAIIDSTDVFPSKSCVKWCGDVLIIII